MGYTKLFNEIVTSTVWGESHTTRVVWITLLAMKNRYHVAETSIPGLAHVSRVTMDECEAALGVLKSPDPYSRSKENEGRRVEECDGGYLILNGEKYTDKMSKDERREYQKMWQRKNRSRKNVNTCQQSSAMSAHIDIEENKDLRSKPTSNVDSSVDTAVNKSTKSTHKDVDVDKDLRSKPTSKRKACFDPKTLKSFIQIYHDHAPSLPEVLKVTDKRKRLIQKKWSEHPDAGFWVAFWAEMVEESDFLSGRGDRKNGHGSFKPNIEWCLIESNFVKIIEGNYANN